MSIPVAPDPAFGVIRILNFGHSGRYVEVDSCFLSFQFPMTYAGKDWREKEKGAAEDEMVR